MSGGLTGEATRWSRWSRVTWRAALAPLRDRSFAWYFASRTVNTLGTTMATIALAFAVLDLEDSATALGQVLAAHTIPMIVLLLVGRRDRRPVPATVVLQVSNVASAVTQGAASRSWSSPAPPSCG